MKYSFPAFENGFVRAAAATPALHVADCAYNAQQIIDAMSVYAAQGVQLVCFPEFCLTGYTCSDLFLPGCHPGGKPRAEPGGAGGPGSCL